MNANLSNYLKYKTLKAAEIATAFGCSFKIWEFEGGLRKSNKNRPRLIREIHADYNSHGVIHFSLKNGAIESVILRPEIYGLNAALTMNFKQAIAEFCKISINEVASKWPNDELHFRDEVKLKKLFGCGFELWQNIPRRNKDEDNFVAGLVFKSRYKNHLKLMTDTWPENKESLHINEQFSLTDIKLFQCPRDFCLYASTHRWNYEVHVANCSDDTKVIFEQKNLLDNDIVDWLIRQNFLSKRPLINHHHVHFDTETILSPTGTINGQTTVIGEEKLISIGISHNFGDTIQSQVFARERMDEKSLNKMVKSFWEALLMLRGLHRKNLDPEINNAFFKITELLYPTEKDVFGKKIKEHLDDPLKCKLHQAHNYLDGLRTLKCVGFNCEHFVKGFRKLLNLFDYYLRLFLNVIFYENPHQDMKLLFPELLKIFDKDPSKDTLELNIIRRGTSIMRLKYDSIEIKDCKSFYKGSLASMGKQFGVDVHKECFPYEKWHDLESMKAAETWPIYPEFKSSLRPFRIVDAEAKVREAIRKLICELGYTASKAVELFDLVNCCSELRITNENQVPVFTINDFSSFCLDPETYVDAFNTFNKLKKTGEIQTMHDYLLVYNKLDCIVGLKAFTKMNELFYDQFQVSLLNNYSIPAASLQILFKFYDTTLNSPYSFGNLHPEIPINIRIDGYKGGLATPLNQRHLEANGDCSKYAFNVTHAANGQVYQQLVVYDITSLYG